MRMRQSSKKKEIGGIALALHCQTTRFTEKNIYAKMLNGGGMPGEISVCRNLNPRRQDPAQKSGIITYPFDLNPTDIVVSSLC